ncbi:Diacylglycerol kinase [hydrothermal vent metagenome]|uniref:Diacylglycerol kinase n=1 Tax=hydrothermal vent metagenome TaxID=652676 RepID=A0A3B0YNM8_9ZZZZ
MAKTGNTGFRRIIRAGGFSWKGFVATFKNEAAFRQELALTLLLVPLALWLTEDRIERALMIGFWLLVPLMEMINSAIESIVDRIGDEYHPLSGAAKDIGSATVVFAMIVAAIVWAVLLFP